MTVAMPAAWAELSMAERLASAPEGERSHLYAALSDDDASALMWDWDFWARPDQVPPTGDWLTWLVLQGRGAGKTRTGSEWVRRRGPRGREGLLVGATPRDVRDLMLEGRSGVLSVSSPSERPRYEPSLLRLTWPNGAIAHVRSAADPESLRGLSVDWAWLDEPAKWKFLDATWDQVRFALREGSNPQTVVTTTPRPVPIIRELVAGKHPGVALAPRVSTYRNRAHLAPSYLAEMEARYEGTRLGMQELHARLLEEVEGALLTLALIEASRWDGALREFGPGKIGPDVEIPRRCVGVDPSLSSKGDECGIVVCGAGPGPVRIHGRRSPAVGYVLDDCSLRGRTDEWGRAAVRAYFDWDCDAMVTETNLGGVEVMERIIRSVPAEGDYPGGDRVRIVPVRASRGKALRAEPVVGLYEQNARGFRRLWHVGHFPELEDQWVTWVPPGQDEASRWSPDRIDAEVWALTWLMFDRSTGGGGDNVDALVGSRMGA